MMSWDNHSGTPVAVPTSQVSYAWSYSCPLSPTNNTNDINYPNGLVCVDYMNPDIGGIRNFDNILYAWIAIMQHIVCQDW